MLVIPELQLDAILKTGFATLAANTALIDELLAAYPAEMRAECRTYFTQRQVEVVQGWPTTAPITTPRVAIIDSGSQESEAHDFLGDEAGEHLPVDVTAVEQHLGYAEMGNYSLLIDTLDPRLAVYTSLLIKALILINKMTLEEAGLKNITLSTNDLRMEGEMPSDRVYSRVVTVRCLHYYEVALTGPAVTALIVSVSNNGVTP